MERTDIEVASRRVDMGSCLRPPSYPRGSFSVISTPHQRGVWGSLGPAFASEFLTDQNTVRPTICPYTLRWISVPPELTLGRAWYTFKPVPPQPNCPSTDVHTKTYVRDTVTRRWCLKDESTYPGEHASNSPTYTAYQQPSLNSRLQ